MAVEAGIAFLWMMLKLDGCEADLVVAGIRYHKAIGYATELNGAVELRENKISLKEKLSLEFLRVI